MNTQETNWRNTLAPDELAVYDRIAALPAEQRPAALADLTDPELRDVQRALYAAGDTRLRPDVQRAILQRPHRGCWPVPHTSGATTQ